jgi:hypothetical protein
MAGRVCEADDRRMRTSPDLEVYDRACDLIEAAAGLRRAAAALESGEVTPAVLGCVEAALRDLRCATTLLERASARHRGYADLRGALASAAHAASEARALTANMQSRPHWWRDAAAGR